MALDPSFAGRTYRPGKPYPVGREKIREFAAALGLTDPEHHDPAAAQARGYPDVIAPPTFPVVLTLATDRLMVDPELGLDYSRVVHGDQRFRYARPVVAGDELAALHTIEEIVSRGGHDFLTIRTDVSSAGEPVVTLWTKLVVRGEG